MFYAQVDVPMERLPVANWVLIALTVLVSIKVWVGDTQAARRVMSAAEVDTAELVKGLKDRRLTDAQKDQMIRDAIPGIDPAAVQQVKNPRLGDAQKEAVLDREYDSYLDRFVRSVERSSDRYALHTAWDEFRWYQLVTYLFLHGGLMHLFGNMLFLFCFGNAVNAKLGHASFLALYFAAGVLAGIASVVLNVGATIGASGAIMGVMGVFLVLYPLNQVAVWDVLWVRLTGDALRIPSWTLIAFYMALDLYGTLARHKGVNYVAHLSGSVFGIGIAATLVLAGWVRSSRGERNLMEIWGWVREQPRKRRRKKPRAPLPPANSETDFDR
jgi:membrane associated rhomboid family serine protease